MCPLILNKKKKEDHPPPEQYFSPEWMRMVADHCRDAQECLATLSEDSRPHWHALQSLVHEDLPALLEKVDRLLH